MSRYMRGPETLCTRISCIAPSMRTEAWILTCVRQWLYDIKDTNQCDDIRELIEKFDIGEV